MLWGLNDKIQIQGDLLWYYVSINGAGGIKCDLEGGAAGYAAYLSPSPRNHP